MPEEGLKNDWRLHRAYERYERLERQIRSNTREFKAKMRACGQIVDPDPVEPTEPYWKRVQNPKSKKDR